MPVTSDASIPAAGTPDQPQERGDHGLRLGASRPGALSVLVSREVSSPMDAERARSPLFRKVRRSAQDIG
jgi:hypothetical protein